VLATVTTRIAPPTTTTAPRVLHHGHIITSPAWLDACCVCVGLNASAVRVCWSRTHLDFLTHSHSLAPTMPTPTRPAHPRGWRTPAARHAQPNAQLYPHNMIIRIMLIVAVVVVHVAFVSRRQSLAFMREMGHMRLACIVTLPPRHCEVTALTSESLATPH
jgi:hypothetical protein